MAVAFSIERAEENNTAWADPQSIGTAFTPAANTLLTVLLGLVDSATGFDTTLSGGSLTWNNVRAGDELASTTFMWQECFYALVGGSPVSTTLSADQTEAITGGAGWCGEWTGHNTTTPIKTNHNHVDNTGSTSPNLSTSDGLADADSAVVMCNQMRRNPPGWTPESGWTTHMDTGFETPTHGFAVWSKIGDPSFTATGTAFPNHGTIFEIDAASAAATSLPIRRREPSIIPLFLVPMLLRSWAFINGHVVSTWVHPMRDVILAARDGLYVPTTREIQELAA